MFAPILAAAASAFAGGVGGAVGDSFGKKVTGSDDGSQEEQQSAYSPGGELDLDTKKVFDTLQKYNITLSPEDQMKLSQRRAKQAGQDNLDLQLQGLAGSIGLTNQARNAETQRSMVINAQKFNADNVANQLNNLQAARATSATAISNAINSGVSAFR